MKFSVLLPTRNRLDLLKYAVTTVLRQDYDDWEIIISDNCSDEDVAGYVASLNDNRIRYFRTDRLIPVTDNWNNALEKSTGDYVLMLGDDDCIMQRYFTTMLKLITDYSQPDFIYTNAFLYAYPGVLPKHPDGFLRPYNRAVFIKSVDEPYLLDHDAAVELVRESMNFRLKFDFNMQFSCVSRRLIQEMSSSGKFFQSPYPDFYAHNVMFLCAQKILICPYPLVTVGISPKSFGFYFFNKKEKEGVSFLQNVPDPSMAKELQAILLPGTDMNTSWLFSMETIRANYGEKYGLAVNYRRYRYLQMVYMCKGHYVDKSVTKEQFKEFSSFLTLTERLRWGVWLRLVFGLAAVVPPSIRKKFGRIMNMIVGHASLEEVAVSGAKTYQNILEVYEQVVPH